MPKFKKGDSVVCILARTKLTRDAVYKVCEVQNGSVRVMDDLHHHTWFYAERFRLVEDNLFSEVQP